MSEAYFVSLHALAPLALHAHDRHSHAEVELLIHWKRGEELGNHAVYLQLHLTLQAIQTTAWQHIEKCRFDSLVRCVLLRHSSNTRVLMTLPDTDQICCLVVYPCQLASQVSVRYINAQGTQRSLTTIVLICYVLHVSSALHNAIPLVSESLTRCGPARRRSCGKAPCH